MSEGKPLLTQNSTKNNKWSSTTSTKCGKKKPLTPTTCLFSTPLTYLRTLLNGYPTSKSMKTSPLTLHSLRPIPQKQISAVSWKSRSKSRIKAKVLFRLSQVKASSTEKAIKSKLSKKSLTMAKSTAHDTALATVISLPSHPPTEKSISWPWRNLSASWLAMHPKAMALLGIQ